MSFQVGVNTKYIITEEFVLPFITFSITLIKLEIGRPVDSRRE